MKRGQSYTFKAPPASVQSVRHFPNIAMSIQRMGLKMEFICGNMKTMQNNQAIMGSFDKMTAMLNYSNNPNF